MDPPNGSATPIRQTAMPAFTRSVLAVLLCSTACAAPTVPTEEVVATATVAPSLELPDDFAARESEYIDAWGRQWPTFRAHGVTSVHVDGRAVSVRARGMRDLAAAVEHDNSSRFATGSLSVHLSQAAALALVQRDALDLDAPVATWVPELGFPKSVTVEHLLTFTSGIPSFIESFSFQAVGKRRPATALQIAEVVAPLPLEFAPGEDFAPSLSNPAVLGLVLERATGISYEEVVRAEVLTPLAMHDTVYGRSAGDAVGVSFAEAEHLVPDTEVDPLAFGPAGGWASTTGDLAKLYTAMLGGRWGDTLMHRAFGDNALGRPWGFATTTVAGKDALYWLGRIDGHSHAVVLVPEDNLVALHLGNSEVVPGEEIALSIAKLAYGLHVPPREEAREVPVPADTLAAYAGTWVLTPSDRELLEATVEEETFVSFSMVQTHWGDDALSLQIRGRAPKTMHTLPSGRFFFKDLPQSTAAVVSAPSAPDQLWLEREGTKLRYRRVSGLAAAKASPANADGSPA